MELGMIGRSYQVQLVIGWDGGLLLISASQVARITGVSHCTWPTEAFTWIFLSLSLHFIPPSSLYGANSKHSLCWVQVAIEHIREISSSCVLATYCVTVGKTSELGPIWLISGGHNKMPRPGGLNNWKLFSHILKAGKSKIKVLSKLVSVEASLTWRQPPSHWVSFILCAHERGKAFWCLSLFL
jgi:hypothetical protein